MDLVAPPALWRLIQIGATAGLFAPADRDAIVDALGNPARRPTDLGGVLDEFPTAATELYILVTLFSAARPVSRPTLARETLADPASLRTSLDRLAALAAISQELTADGESSIGLTASGLQRAGLLIYLVLRLAVPLKPARAKDAAPLPALDDAKSNLG